MSTPYDPGRPEDRPADQPGYPAAPPSQNPQYPQGQGESTHQSYPSGQQPSQQGWDQQQNWDQGQQNWNQQERPAWDQGGQQGQPQQGWDQGQQQGQQGWNQPQGQQNWDHSGQQQPYAGGPGGFPGAPSYQNAPAYDPSQQGFGTPPGARPNMAAPMEVVRASQLMFARVAIGIVSAILAFTSGDAIKDSIRNNDPSLSQDQIDSAYNVGVGVAVVFGLIFAVLYVLLAIQVRKGKNWARIVTWVLAGLGVLSGLLGLFGGTSTGLEKGVGVVLLLIDIGIIVLLTRKPANEYFKAMQMPRY